jgi:serine/threonine protein kinase
MAEIYRATDTVLGRDVAVKVLAEHQAQDEDVRARFLREALAAARLSGEPNTVSVYDVGEAEGRPFIVMAFLGGGSLATRLRDGPVPEGQALAWLEQAARALDSAHARGIVHRDVKPANLLLDDDGNLHVADFGIARADGLDSHTQTGVVLGTAGYLAPEQAAGLAATPAADRYALAVVAHELVTGVRPGESGGRPLSPALGAFFVRALSERPDERYGSSLELVAALREALAGDEPTTVVAAAPRRRRTPAFVAGLIALGLLGYVLVSGLDAHGGRAPARSPQVNGPTVTAPARTSPPPKQVVDVKPGKGHGRGHHDHGQGQGDGNGD